MKSILLCIALLIWGVGAQAERLPQPQLEEILNFAEKTGELSQPGHETWKTLSHKNSAGEIEKREYLNLVGRTDYEGEFYRSSFHVVSERWSRNKSGNHEVNQWILFMNLEGELVRIHHNLLELEGSRLVRMKKLQSGLDDPKTLKKWRQTMNFWFEQSQLL